MSSPLERLHADYWRYIANNPGCSPTEAGEAARAMEARRHSYYPPEPPTDRDYDSRDYSYFSFDDDDY